MVVIDGELIAMEIHYYNLGMETGKMGKIGDFELTLSSHKSTKSPHKTYIKNRIKCYLTET